jgi:hypothetical protein
VKSRYLLVAALALMVACDSIGGATSTTATSSTTTTSTVAETTAPSTSPTTLPPGTEALSEELRREITRLIAATEELRQLAFIEPPNVVVVSPEELAQRVMDQLEEDLEDIEADEDLYKLLGLFPHDSDLRETLTALYGEQVAGYYDGEAEELVVPIRQDDFSSLEEATVVHELTHALTDQHFDFHQRFIDLLDSDRFDEASAYQAVIEGDATLVEIFYIRQLSFEEQQEFFEEMLEIDSAIYDAVPQFLQDSLVFPYDRGFVFVQGLYDSGGFGAINAAYTNPPLSSEQIIEPFDFGRDEPIEVVLPELVIDGYEEAYQSTWGELGFRLMFDQVLDGDDPAADGWGGDAYRLYTSGEEVLMIMLYRGDTSDDAEELASALVSYITTAMAVGESESDGRGSRFVADDYAFLQRDGDQLWFVVATDPQAGERARQGLPALVG